MTYITQNCLKNLVTKLKEQVAPKLIGKTSPKNGREIISVGNLSFPHFLDNIYEEETDRNKLVLSKLVIQATVNTSYGENNEGITKDTIEIKSLIPISIVFNYEIEDYEVIDFKLLF